MLNNDFLMEEWTDQYLFERTELPRIWTTLNNGFIIQELQPDKIDDVMKIVQQYYLTEEPMMVGSKMLKDKKSVQQYLYLVRHWMMDTLSTIAVERETGNIVGFLICRFCEISRRDPEFSRECIYEGETWKELQKFKHYLTQRSKTYTHYNIEKLLEVYSWFVLPMHRGKGIGSALLKNVAFRQLPEYEWYDTDVIAGVFTSKKSQHVAESLGMKTLYDFAYKEWIVKNAKTGHDEPFFMTLASSHLSAKVMAMQVKPEMSKY